MRYVTVDNLTEGMELARAFFGDAGALMLKKNAVLTNAHIRRIKQLKYSGLYIEDEFSDGIEPEFVISDELRNSTVAAVRRFLVNIQLSDSSASKEDAAKILNFVKAIVNEIAESKNAVINVIDLKSFDMYTYQHSVNVCVLSGVLGVALGMSREQLFDLISAAIFHDIGKVIIPKVILNKPSELTGEEFEEIKKHPTAGAEYMRDKLSLSPATYIPVYQHHERYDGAGYPQGLIADEIVPFAKIISLADVYDAITTKRPYHDACAPHEACEYIMGNTGQHFYPQFAELFLKTLAPFPIGISVQLSNGQEGIVVKNHIGFPMRPLIKLMQKPGLQTRYLDLCNDPDALNVTISRLL